MDKKIIRTGIENILKTNEDINFKHINQTFADMGANYEIIGDITACLFFYLHAVDRSVYTKITPNDILEFIDSKINK